MSVSLDRIVDVNVNLSVPIYESVDFTKSLIIDNEVPEGVDPSIIGTEIMTVNTNNFADELLDLGYTTESLLYKKVLTYFSQNNSPDELLIAGQGVEESLNEAFNRILASGESFYSFCFSKNSDTSDFNISNANLQSKPSIFFRVINSVSDTDYARYVPIYILPSQEEGYLDTRMDDAAMMAVFAGYCTLGLNSAFDMCYKTLNGISANDLTSTELDNIISKRTNTYCKFGNSYSFVYPGITNDGTHLDIAFLIDAAKEVIQKSVIGGLTSQIKVPYTDDGLSYIISLISDSCNKLYEAGFIDSGIWKARSVGALNTDDAIENGFYITSGNISDQSIQDRHDRKAPPIYIALLASGAVEHIVINAYISE